MSEWQTIKTAPDEGRFLATVRVYSHQTGEFLYHDMHVVWIDEETGDIAGDAYQGWNLDDYEFWMPLPSAPEYGDDKTLTDRLVGITEPKKARTA